MEQLTPLQAIILGIVQGLTEFLPISSSGHLILVRDVLHYPDPGKTFDVLTHVGTLIALVVYFRKELQEILAGAFSSFRQRQLFGSFHVNLFWFLGISTIPGGLFGALFNEPLEKITSVYVISILLIVFGLLMFAADRMGKKIHSIEKVTWQDALLIGMAQAIALFPGVSRSGISMTAAMFRGYTREAAARFSFLISIPLIAGISAYKIMSIAKAPPEGGVLYVYFLGIVAAAVSGFLCIKFLLDFLKKGTFTWFVVYRVVMGLSLIIMGVLGLLKSTAM